MAGEAAGDGGALAAAADLLEGVDIDALAALGGDLGLHLERYAEGLVEVEGALAGQLRAGGVQFLLETRQAVVEGLGEALLLGADLRGDGGLAGLQLGVGGAEAVDDGGHELVEERLVEAQRQAAEAGGAAEDLAQDVAASLVGGEDAVGDGEGQRADVVGDAAHRGGGLGVVAVGDACATGLGAGDDRVAEGGEQVALEDGADALHGGGDALEAGAGIDTRARQRRGQLAGGHQLLLRGRGVVLLEDEVPQLDVAVAALVLGRVGGGAPGGAAVQEDLGAGAARTAVAHGSPPVVGHAEADDALGADADAVAPDGRSLVVVLVDRNPEQLGVEFETLDDELPAPGDGFLLEVVTEAEVAQHLEEGEVAGGVADLVEVVGAQALLGGGHAAARRLLDAEEVGHERLHARGSEVGRRVVGSQLGARQHEVLVLRKELEEAGADQVTSHRA